MKIQISFLVLWVIQITSCHFPEQKREALYLRRSRTCQRLSECLKQTVREGRWRGNRCTPRLLELGERGYATAATADELLEPVNSEWGAERWKVMWRVNERWRSWAHLAFCSLAVNIIIINLLLLFAALFTFCHPIFTNHWNKYMVLSHTQNKFDQKILSSSWFIRHLERKWDSSVMLESFLQMHHTDVVTTSTSCPHSIMITHLNICFKRSTVGEFY